MLEAERQSRLLMKERVGAVFRNTGQATAFEILRLILNKWQWLEEIAENEPRPFVYVMTLRGRARRIVLAL
jgi:hypothetical protein